LFAVVDIETTGGNPISERIIEIAIIIFDGNKIIDEYTTLVNPEMKIGYFVSRLTGITNKMVQHAPTIKDVAEQIVNLTEGKVFVAHNAHFDYNFIKYELKRLDIHFSRKVMDTVQLSRKTFPQYRSHGLSNICRELDILIDNRHRALGDAKATIKLLEKIIVQHNGNFLKEAMEGDIPKLHLPKQLPPQILDELPEETGIIYFLDNSGEIIALQSAKNIKGHIYKMYKDKQYDKYKKLLHTETADIHTEILGNELIATLLEDDYKERHQPKYNKKQQYYDFNFGLFASKDENGLKKLFVKMIDDAEEPLIKFTSKFKAEKVLEQIMDSSGIRPLFQKIDSKYYSNERLEAILAKYRYPSDSFFIILNGRNGTEQCAIRIKNDHLMGYTFFEPSYISHIQELDDLLTPIKEFSNTKKHIINYINKNKKYLKIVKG
jgi:DNA polymerase-3 subunit epsilon